MKRGHCILAAGLCILAGLVSGCGDKKQQTSEEITTAEDGTVAVEVLDNDQIALVYNGYDPEVHGMMFTITNKSDDQMVNVYFSDVVVDGETLQPMFGLDVEAQTSEDQICLVDCDAAPAALTGIVCVDDMEGYTIGTYEIDDVALSNEKDDTKEYTVKEGAVTILDNDKVTVSYIGIENDSDGDDAEQVLAFEVYNKKDKKIQATFDTVLVNGKEEEISYVADAMGHTYATLFCDVSDVKAMTTLTGEFTVYDEDDELIGSYSIEKAALK